MLFLNDKSKSLNVFFLKEHHLALLKRLRIPLSHLPHLLFYPVHKDDALDWISHQRAVELTLFKRKFTTYDITGNHKFLPSDMKVDLELFLPELEKVYNENKYYDELQFSSYRVGDDTIVILNRGNGMVEPGFTMTEKSQLVTLYQAVLNTLGYHGTYFREPVRNRDHEGVGLPELISILTK